MMKIKTFVLALGSLALLASFGGTPASATDLPEEGTCSIFVNANKKVVFTDFSSARYQFRYLDSVGNLIDDFVTVSGSSQQVDISMVRKQSGAVVARKEKTLVSQPGAIQYVGLGELSRRKRIQVRCNF